MNLQILKDIAKQLDSLDVDDATKTEENIARLLIKAGLLKIETHSYGIIWKEYKSC